MCVCGPIWVTAAVKLNDVWRPTELIRTAITIHTIILYYYSCENTAAAAAAVASASASVAAAAAATTTTTTTGARRCPAYTYIIYILLLFYGIHVGYDALGVYRDS